MARLGVGGSSPPCLGGQRTMGWVGSYWRRSVCGLSCSGGVWPWGVGTGGRGCRSGERAGFQPRLVPGASPPLRTGGAEAATGRISWLGLSPAWIPHVYWGVWKVKHACAWAEALRVLEVRLPVSQLAFDWRRPSPCGRSRSRPVGAAASVPGGTFSSWNMPECGWLGGAVRAFSCSTCACARGEGQRLRVVIRRGGRR